MKYFLILLLVTTVRASDGQTSANTIRRPYTAINPVQTTSPGTSGEMLSLGDLYWRKGQVDSAVTYYTRAAVAGASDAYVRLGGVYRTGGRVPQDLAKAAAYYRAGADSGNEECKAQIAYFYFKGMGVPQSYAQAMPLFQEQAKRGVAWCERFLGFCYRNGFGVPVNSDSARYWLRKAAAQNEPNAIHELVAEPFPENRSLIDPELTAELTRLRQYKEQFSTANSNDISGNYTGYAIYQDFSRNFVSRIVPLQVHIAKNKDSIYEGTWTEGNPDGELTAVVKARFAGNILSFDSSSRYIRHDQYTHERPTAYRFENANLNIQYFDDSVHLSGDVQFYNLNSKEPGQPMFIALTKSNITDTVAAKSALWNQTVADLSLTLYPNPAKTVLNARFSLRQPGKADIRIFDIAGRLMLIKTSSLLPAGTYSYPLDLRELGTGVYILQVITGDGKQSQKFIKIN